MEEVFASFEDNDSRGTEQPTLEVESRNHGQAAKRKDNIIPSLGPQ